MIKIELDYRYAALARLVVVIMVLLALEIEFVDCKVEKDAISAWGLGRTRLDAPEPHSVQRPSLSFLRVNQRTSCESAGTPVQPTRRSTSYKTQCYDWTED